MRDYLRVIWKNGKSNVYENIKDLYQFDDGGYMVTLDDGQVLMDVEIEDIYYFYKRRLEWPGCMFRDYSLGVTGYFNKVDDGAWFVGTIKEMEDYYETNYR